MQPLVIRDVEPADLPALTAIYREAVLADTATFEFEPPSEAAMAERFQQLKASGYPALAAIGGGVVLGYATAGVFRVRPAFRFTAECSIYIALGARQTGIGRALLSHLIERAAEAGVRQMVAVIGDSRTSEASIALHASAGFTRAGRIEAAGYKHGRWLDVVMMQRAIGPGATSPPGERGPRL